MGVSGAGLATVISQAFSVLLCIIYMWKRYPMFRVKKSDFLIKIDLLKKLSSSWFLNGNDDVFSFLWNFSSSNCNKYLWNKYNCSSYS